jgi:hypothetical protein
MGCVYTGRIGGATVMETPICANDALGAASTARASISQARDRAKRTEVIFRLLFHFLEMRQFCGNRYSRPNPMLVCMVLVAISRVAISWIVAVKRQQALRLEFARNCLSFRF